MTQLKTNFAIRTTDENFRAHVETLKALGYGISGPVTRAGSMEGNSFLAINENLTDKICRYFDSKGLYSSSNFNTIQDFLVWHFTPELPQKSEAEILLDSLEEEMQQLQTKIAAVREQMLKEIKERK